MDIKIGAVFSLAGSELDQDTDSEHSNEAMEADEKEEEEEEIFIPFEPAEVPPNLNEENVDEGMAINGTENECFNESTGSAISEGERDCPPSLLMETSTTVAPSGEDDWQEHMMPPVLEREKMECQDEKETSEQPASTEASAKPTLIKIAPSYLVLTNVRQGLKNGNRISYRKFKRTFKECTNMCKKMHFRRRLYSGKDVFNVKSPSKQKPYQLYLQKGKEPDADVTVKQAPPFSPNLKVVERKDLDVVSLLALHDKMLLKKMKTSGRKKSVARKRRVIQHVPTDFRMSNIGVSGDGDTEEESQDEKEARILKLQHEAMLKEMHKNELANLRAQIKMKRRANKGAKLIRKMEIKKSVNDFVSGVSLKGRKRKSNCRYGPEFATTPTELNQYVEIAKFEKQMAKLEKQMEKDQKRREDKMNSRILQLDAKESSKVDLVIDNPENDQVKTVKTEKGTLEKYSVKERTQIGIITARNEKIERKATLNQLKARVLKSRSKKPADGDMVLIRDMPTGDQLISGLLGVTDRDLQSSLPDTEMPYVIRQDSDDPYTYAKSLLKSSLVSTNEYDSGILENKSSELGKLLQKPAGKFHMTPDMEMDKAKKLRIPENVQKLFKAKQEPVVTKVSPNSSCKGSGAFTSGPCKPEMKTLTGKPYLATVQKQTIVKSDSDKTSNVHAPKLLPASMKKTAPGSPIKKTILIQPVGQTTPSSGGTPLLLKTGSLPIPVTIKSGPNGDKIITVLVDQYGKNLVSQNTAKSSQTGFYTTYAQPPKSTAPPSSVLKQVVSGATVLYPAPGVDQQGIPNTTVFGPANALPANFSQVPSQATSKLPLATDLSPRPLGSPTTQYTVVSPAQGQQMTTLPMMTHPNTPYTTVSAAQGQQMTTLSMVTPSSTPYTVVGPAQGQPVPTPAALTPSNTQYAIASPAHQGQQLPIPATVTPSNTQFTVVSPAQGQHVTTQATMIPSNTLYSMVSPAQGKHVTSEATVIPPNTHFTLVNSARGQQLIPKPASVTPSNTQYPIVSPALGQQVTTQATATSMSLIKPQVSSSVFKNAPIIKTTGPIEKTKFYLLKVDGKNILIPMNPGQTESPTAFVVNNDAALKGAISSAVLPLTAAMPIVANTPPTAATAPRSTVKIPSSNTSLAKLPLPVLQSAPISSITTKTLPKPTATITPNVKPAVPYDYKNPTPLSGLQFLSSCKSGVESGVDQTRKATFRFDGVGDSSAALVNLAKTASSEENTYIAKTKTKPKIKTKPVVFKSASKTEDDRFSVKQFFENVAATTGMSQYVHTGPSETHTSNAREHTWIETETNSNASEETDIETDATSDARDETGIERETLSDADEETGAETEAVSDAPVENEIGAETAESEMEVEVEEGKEEVVVKPFAEGVTDREEKLRKLKELLREKQKAVDEIRANRLKTSDD